MADVIALGRLSAHDVCRLHRHVSSKQSVGDQAVLGVLVFYGSWNTHMREDSIHTWMQGLTPRLRQGIQYVTGVVLVDESEDSLQICIGDNDAVQHVGSCPPEELPSVAIVHQTRKMDHSVARFVPEIRSLEFLSVISDKSLNSSKHNVALMEHIEAAIDAFLTEENGGSKRNVSMKNGIRVNTDDAIRIFVSGDRSSVGKSSVSLGLLGSLVKMGYNPRELAYIKPATQCERTQLVETYCKRVGIDCVPVGPVVYYKGFTRAFLAGETLSSEELLQQAGNAVDQVAKGKQLVVIDGVGFPAVGSICGTDNAKVARASGYRLQSNGVTRKPPAVLLVGGSGVGAAVDAFNLNATYFAAQNVPVIGGIFNKLALDGFYSLENCKKQVTAYFDKNGDSRRPFGFVPQVPELAGDNASEHIDDFIQIFGSNVNISAIIQSATQVKNSAFVATVAKELRPPKRVKLNSGIAKLTRSQIESKAQDAGAAPSA